MTRHYRMIEYNRRTQSLTEWAREIDISPDALRSRLNKGWPLDRAMAPGRAPTRRRLIEYKARTQSLTEWAREIGVPFHTLRQRLNKGWPLDRAMTTGWRGRPALIRETDDLPPR